MRNVSSIYARPLPYRNRSRVADRNVVRRIVRHRVGIQRTNPPRRYMRYRNGNQ